jgi:membrane-bound lytic murein transglycosylase B
MQPIGLGGIKTMAIGLRATIALLLIGLTSLSLAQSAAFEQCLSDLRQAASDRGVSSQTTSDLLASVTPNPRVIELDRRQPEFTSTLHDYLERRVTEERIERGRRLLDQHRDQLDALTQEYGVPGRYIIAFWGLETNYGSYVGRMSTIRSLATLACDRRRGAFFRNELIAALELVDRDVLRADQLNGSWAGALGNFQFLPSVYRDHAVDADSER